MVLCINFGQSPQQDYSAVFENMLHILFPLMGPDLRRVITMTGMPFPEPRWEDLGDGIKCWLCSFAINREIPYQPQGHPRRSTPPRMSERTRRTHVGNHGSHVKGEQTTGTYSLIETSTVYSRVSTFTGSFSNEYIPRDSLLRSHSYL